MKRKLQRFWLETKQFANELFDEDPMCIRPYLSYSNKEKVFIKGRILEQEGVFEVEDSTIFQNLVQNLQSFETDEAKHTQVIITYMDKVMDTMTDDDGYFEAEFKVEQEATNGEFLDWSRATITAPEFKNKKGEVLETKASILLPHQDTEDIIVSDIDDTVLVTNVNSFLKLKVIFNTLFKNEQTRLPFEDIAEVLHELTLNKKGHQVNPIFYLSNSPWNLYELLHNFLKFNDIPLGPLFLRDFGLKFGEELYDFRNHKLNTLHHLIEFFDKEKFILIGDATESDTDIYLDIFKKFPERIEHIYIRGDKAKKNEVVLQKINEHPEVPIHLIEHSQDILKFQEKKHKH